MSLKQMARGYLKTINPQKWPIYMRGAGKAHTLAFMGDAYEAGARAFLEFARGKAVDVEAEDIPSQLILKFVYLSDLEDWAKEEWEK